MPWIYPGQWQLEIAMAYGGLLLPLIVGLPPLLAIMEGVFVMTEREIWKQMARFWGELFGIALYVCGFGVLLLAIGYFFSGGVMTWISAGVLGALVLVVLGEIALYRWCFRDWWSRSRLQHWLLTLFMASLPHLAILIIAALGGWAASAAGTAWNSGAQLHAGEMHEVFFNAIAQLRFVHLTSVSYLTACGLVLSVSAYYLLNRRNVQIARRSMTVAASFGLAAALSLAVRGGTLDTEDASHAVMMLWSFRAMIAIGLYLLLLFLGAFYLASRRRLHQATFLRMAMWSLPLPWFAAALGWIATEIHDGHWSVERISRVTGAQAQLTALVFACIALIVMIVLVAQALRVVKGGPERLKLWPADAGAGTH